jgi:hypothetical protein
MGRDHVSELRQITGLLFIPPVIHKYKQQRWNDTESGKERTLIETCPSDTFLYISHIDPDANPDLCSERTATHGLSCGTTLRTRVRWINWSDYVRIQLI